jgi:hypothetical protein
MDRFDMLRSKMHAWYSTHVHRYQMSWIGKSFSFVLSCLQVQGQLQVQTCLQLFNCSHFRVVQLGMLEDYPLERGGHIKALSSLLERGYQWVFFICLIVHFAYNGIPSTEKLAREVSTSLRHHWTGSRTHVSRKLCTDAQIMYVQLRIQ